jgi:hypothetical protein
MIFEGWPGRNFFMKQKIYLFLYLLNISAGLSAQSVSDALRGNIDKQGRYLFYLHAGVVSVKGNNAVNDAMPGWGPYEYLNILDSLSNRGFHVISEIRKQGAEDSIYALKIASQLDTLLRAGIAPAQILVLGASSGWGVGLMVSSMMADNRLNYVMMGGCWPETFKDFERIKLYGKFLSIIESSDPHGTCISLLNGREQVNWEEITLHTGLSHGFFYKVRAAWMDPVMAWFQKRIQKKSN